MDDDVKVAKSPKDAALDAYLAALIEQRNAPPKTAFEELSAVAYSGAKVGIWVGAVILFAGTAGAIVSWISPSKSSE